MRQPERDARQAGRPHVPPSAGGGIDVTELTEAELSLVGERLPLSRLDGAQTYLVAREDEEPVGHAHVAWEGTRLGVPEIQDVYVGTVLIRGKPVEVDDTLVYLVKDLGVDSGPARSS